MLGVEITYMNQSIDIKNRNTKLQVLKLDRSMNIYLKWENKFYLLSFIEMFALSHDESTCGQNT